MSYTEFLITYNFPSTPKEYAIVFDAIPPGIRMLFKDVQDTGSSVSLPNLMDTHVGKICLTHYKNSNKKICALFQSEYVTTPYVVSYWNSLYMISTGKKFGQFQTNFV